MSIKIAALVCLALLVSCVVLCASGHRVLVWQMDPSDDGELAASLGVDDPSQANIGAVCFYFSGIWVDKYVYKGAASPCPLLG